MNNADNKVTKECFKSYAKALDMLRRICEETKNTSFDNYKQMAIIKCFEMTYNVAWDLFDARYHGRPNKLVGGKRHAQIVYDAGFIENIDLWNPTENAKKSTSDAIIAEYGFNDQITAKVTNQILTVFLPEFERLSTYSLGSVKI